MKHLLLKKYVQTLIKGEINALIVRGEKGLGKTSLVFETLEENKLRENIHYIYHTGHITPLKLFKILKKVNQLKIPKLLVIDDMNTLLLNKTAINILKSSIWKSKSKRIITFETSRLKEKDTKFEFIGKVILIFNFLNENNEFTQTLVDRAIDYKIELNSKELKEYIEDIIPKIICKLKVEERFKVWNEVKGFSDNQKFSIRALERAFEFFRINKDDWKELFLNTLDLNKEQIEFHKVEGLDISTKEKEKAFMGRTKKSRRSYYRVKHKLKKYE